MRRLSWHGSWHFRYTGPPILPPFAENHHGPEYPRRRCQLRSLSRRQEDRPFRHRQGGRLSRRPRLFRVDRPGRSRQRRHAGAAIGLRLARAGRRGCAGRARAAQAGRVRRHPVHGDAHGHPGRRAIVYGETHVFLGPRFIITVRHGPSAGYAKLRERKESVPEKLASGPGYVLYSIIDFIVDQYQPCIDHLQARFQHYELQLFKPSLSRRQAAGFLPAQDGAAEAATRPSIRCTTSAPS